MLKPLLFSATAISSIIISFAEPPEAKLLRADDVAILDPLADGSPPPVAEEEPRPKHTVRAQKTQTLSEGQKLTVGWIDKPDLPSFPTEVPEVAVPEATLSAEEIAELEAQFRHHRWISLGATVVDEKATFLNWHHEGKRYTAWSNLNFKHPVRVWAIQGSGQVLFAVHDGE